MATIANLAVSITARIGSFEKGFARAQKIAARFGADIGRHTLTVAKWAGALVAAAAGALALLTKNQLAAIDSTSKLARTVGLSTEELAGYQHAADLAGVDSEAFSKGVVRMNRTIADAASGSKTAERELSRVGLRVADLANLSTDQRIELLADRYLTIGDAAERSSFLMNVFGRSGIGIGNLFEQGSKGIAAAQQEAEKLGLTFSEIDGRRVEEANDMLTRAKAILTGIGRTIAVLVSPYILGLAEDLVKAGTAGEGMGGMVVNAFNWVVKAIARATDYFELLKAGWFGFQAIVHTGAGIVVSMVGLIAKAIQELINLLPGVEKSFGDNILASVGDFKQAAVESSAKAAEAYERFDKKVNSSAVGMTFERWKKRADEIAGGIRRGAEAAGELEESSTKSTFARAIDLKRVTVGGISANQDGGTTRKQGDAMITALRRIEQNTSGRWQTTAVVV